MKNFFFLSILLLGFTTAQLATAEEPSFSVLGMVNPEIEIVVPIQKWLSFSAKPELFIATNFEAVDLYGGTVPLSLKFHTTGRMFQGFVASGASIFGNASQYLFSIHTLIGFDWFLLRYLILTAQTGLTYVFSQGFNLASTELCLYYHIENGFRLGLGAQVFNNAVLIGMTLSFKPKFS